MMIKRFSPGEYEAILKRLRDTTQKSGERLALMPLLSANEIEQLQQLFHPTWDGNVISKCMRDSLWDRSLIDRWNGWNFTNQYGMCVLDTLGLLDEDWHSKLHKNCGPRRHV